MLHREWATYSYSTHWKRSCQFRVFLTKSDDISSQSRLSYSNRCTWRAYSRYSNVYLNDSRGKLLLNKRSLRSENAEIASFNFIWNRLLRAHVHSIYEFCRHPNEACANVPMWCERIIIKINYFDTFMYRIINETLCLLDKRWFSILIIYFIGEMNVVFVCIPGYVVCTVCLHRAASINKIKRCWPKLIIIFPGGSRLNVKRRTPKSSLKVY